MFQDSVVDLIEAERVRSAFVFGDAGDRAQVDERHRRVGRLHEERVCFGVLLSVTGEGWENQHGSAAGFARGPQRALGADYRNRVWVADLRGKSPFERAHEITDKCAHPDFRDLLRRYMNIVEGAPTPHTLSVAFKMHEQFQRTGDMRGCSWTEAIEE